MNILLCNHMYKYGKIDKKLLISHFKEKLECYKQTNIEITGDMKARFLDVIYTYCLEDNENVFFDFFASLLFNHGFMIANSPTVITKDTPKSVIRGFINYLSSPTEINKPFKIEVAKFTDKLQKLTTR